MIEINLLPGGGRQKKGRSGGGRKVDLRASLGSIGGRVNDPYLLSAIAGVVLGAAVVGYLYTSQTTREEEVTLATEQAIADSTRFANFSKQRRRAEATRDTILRQINVIRAIDGDRYLWPHLLDEVSRALPQYTWLTSVAPTGTPQGTTTPLVVGNDSARAAAAPRPNPNDSTKKVAAVDTAVAPETVRIEIEGQTVDIEAITRFMRQLEASPFIGEVQLGNSQLAIEGGREVTTFQLTATFVRATEAVRRVPLRAGPQAAIGGGN